MVGDRYDVVVVGGGLSGLVAARTAGERGASVVLLEATDRLGGRLWTRSFAGQQVELGGTYVAPDRAPVLRAEIERYGLELTAYKLPESVMFHVGGRLQSGAQLLLAEGHHLERAVARIHADSMRIERSRPLVEQGLEDLDMPFTEYVDALKLSRTARDFIDAWAQANCPASLDHVSALSMLELVAGGNVFLGMFPMNSKRFKAGASALVAAVAHDSRATIQYNSPVSGVSSDKNSVTVALRDGSQVAGKSAVIAVPLNVLGTIEFDPRLTGARLEYARKGQPGRSFKLWATVRGVDTDTLVVGIGGGLHKVHTQRIGDGVSLLVGDASLIDAIDPTDRASIQAALRHLLPDAELLKWDLHDWARDPFINGTYAIYRPGEMARSTVIGGSEGRLHFAGADTSERRGMEGAIQTGLSAGTAAASVAGSS